MKRNFFASLCLCILLCPQIPAQNPTVSETRIHSETRIQPSSSTSEQQTATIPEGTVIHLSLKEPLSSKLSEVGDEVIAAVKRDVVVDGQTVLRQGAEVIGRVTVAKPARMPLKGGMLHISFDRIRLED
ncbi:MAG TPA: hypothetical protein VEF04_03450, partial [Blastocatellia bacterium]|nr:hypothetical protein [Blastocatellia bacterium]